MYELIQVSGGSYYVQSPAKAGVGAAERYGRVPH